MSTRATFPVPALTAAVVLTLALLAFLLFASCSAPSDLDGAVLSEPETTGTMESASNLTATATPAPLLAQTPTPTPSPTPAPTAMPDSVAHMTFRHPRLTPDTIDQYIFRADVIVRASFLSATAGVESAGAASLPVNNLRFKAVEYLKGTGAAEFTVVVAPLAYSETTHATRQEAQSVAEEQLAARNTTWDNKEGVLFLTRGTWGAYGASGSSGSEEPLRFAWRGVSESPWNYSLNKLERVWLPAQSAAGAGGQSDADMSYLTSVGGGQTSGATGSAGTSAISLADLRSRIAAMDALLAKGAGIEDYEDCISGQLQHGTQAREYLARTGRERTRPVYERHISSGMAAGESISSEPEHYTYTESPRYSRFWMEGADREHFVAGVLDDDQDPTNGWFFYERTARPLPSGTYDAATHYHSYFNIPCNFDPNLHFLHRVIVTAPPGTVHEAFFDPVAIGSAIGADGANGALRPTAFTANGTATAMQSLKWDSTGIVTLTLSPNASLSGLAMDFIALDGTIPLTLPASAAKTDGAAGTLRWSMLNSPWQAGDKLMLRIRNATSSPVPTATSPSIPTATPTPTLMPSPTPTPTALPDAPPGVVSGQ